MQRGSSSETATTVTVPDASKKHAVRESVEEEGADVAQSATQRPRDKTPPCTIDYYIEGSESEPEDSDDDRQTPRG